MFNCHHNRNGRINESSTLRDSIPPSQFHCATLPSSPPSLSLLSAQEVSIATLQPGPLQPVWHSQCQLCCPMVHWPFPLHRFGQPSTRDTGGILLMVACSLLHGPVHTLAMTDWENLHPLKCSAARAASIDWLLESWLSACVFLSPYI